MKLSISAAVCHAVPSVTLLLVAISLTFGIAVAVADASTRATATAMPPIVSQLKTAVEQALSPVADKVSPYVPQPLRELVPPFLQGAVSLVMVGRRGRLPPASVNGPNGDQVLLHTTAKFLYAAGAITAELILLQLVYREPYRNLRRNPMNRLLCSPAGFALLVLLSAIPNDVIDTSLLCIFMWKLSASVYTPAIVCGQLLRVYVAALVSRLPPLSAAYAALLTYWDTAVGSETLTTPVLPYDVVHEAWAEVVLIAVVVGAVVFTVAARRDAGGGVATVASAMSREPESDADDYYDW